ncbi:MAG: Kazal-type serine protease inhibitor [Bacteroidota bacterium]
MKYICTFLLGVLVSAGLQAQTYGCVDSLAISPTFPCPNSDYYPVCGCDGKTYRTQCDAQQRYGVRTWTDGSCSGYEFDIIPTYNPYYLYFTLVQATPNFSRMFIVDIYGKLWYEREITAAPREYLQIDITSLAPGPYIIYVYDSKGTYRWKKFLKTSI